LGWRKEARPDPSLFAGGGKGRYRKDSGEGNGGGVLLCGVSFPHLGTNKIPSRIGSQRWGGRNHEEDPHRMVPGWEKRRKETSNREDKEKISFAEWEGNACLTPNGESVLDRVPREGQKKSLAAKRCWGSLLSGGEGVLLGYVRRGWENRAIVFFPEKKRKFQGVPDEPENIRSWLGGFCSREKATGSKLAP